MTIATSLVDGQSVDQFYQQLLTRLRRDLSPIQQLPRRQHWRFVQPEPNPALRAYWSELYKDELAVLNQQSIEYRSTTPITTDTITHEDHDVSIHKAS